MLRKFWKSRSGNFAYLAAIAAVPLVLGIGMATDYSRHVAAKRHLQEIADSVSLALAIGTDRKPGTMVPIAQKFINANISSARIDNVDHITPKDIVVDGDNIDVTLSGYVDATFMGIIGYKHLNVKASSLAVRSPAGNVEVALVLDNTWSMSETDAGGIAKIDALKSAAGSLIDTLMADASPGVRIALVPYADRVNVGAANRNKSWLSVPKDVAAVAPTCTTTTQLISTDCDVWVNQMCTTTVDGAPVQYNCGYCSAYKPAYMGPVTSCTGQVWASTFYGCIGSRMPGTTRLDDQSFGVPYPGYVEPAQYCLNPIVPLTTNKAALKTAVASMIINFSWWYRPSTYIPAGMIWGVNVLSPTAPFSEGAAYDPDNRKPRKAIVLMTDGDNTLQFRSYDGQHVSFSSDAATADAEFKTVNAETNLICDYAKSKNIEIFSIAFLVTKPEAKAMLQKCATDSAHYFDATDKVGLEVAFTGISKSLSLVRLAR